MKKTAIAMLFLLMGTIVAAQTPSGFDLFQQGLKKEKSEGKLLEAIALYERVVRDFSANRSLAAKALVRIGRCYETLGREEAKRAYERVVRDYPEQAEALREARTRLTTLDRPPQPQKGVVVRELATLDWRCVAMHVSPDGRYLTCTDWQTGDLALHDRHSGAVRRLTNKGPWSKTIEWAELSAVFSPDSKQIAYAWFKDGVYELRLIGVNGGDPRTLSRPQQSHMIPLAWTPDAKTIAAVQGSSGTELTLMLIDVTTGAHRSLQKIAKPIMYAVFSPNGDALAYSLPSDDLTSQRDIFIFSLGARTTKKVVEHPANDRVLGWNSHGLLFASDRGGSTGLYVLPFQNGEPQTPRLIRQDVAERSSPLGMSRRGDYYYQVPLRTREVYTAHIDTRSGRVVDGPVLVSRKFVGNNSAPAWSPDGNFLAYMHRGPKSNDVETIVIRSVESGEERELRPAVRNFQAPGIGHAVTLSWSPDAKAFLVNGTTHGGYPGILQVDAATGEVTALMPKEQRTRFAQVSRDASTLYFSRYGENLSYEIAQRNAGSGEVQSIYRTHGVKGLDNIRSLVLSPDGGMIAFSGFSLRGNDAKSTVMVMPVGGEARAVFETSEQLGLVVAGWTQDGTEVLVTGANPQNRNALLAIPIQGGSPRTLNLGMKVLHNIRFHPDGRRVAFDSGEEKAEIWVMENLFAGTTK